MQQYPGDERPDPSDRTSARPRRRVWLAGAVAVTVLAGAGTAVAQRLDLFSDNGEPMSFGSVHSAAAAGTGKGAGHGDTGRVVGDVSFPTGPEARFVRATRLADGTEIGKTTLAGAKSGFTGNVWVWTPKEYSEPRYARSAFPVLIALPGGHGYPTNYWMGTGLGLQKAVSDGVAAGTSLPFILVMPVINPDKKFYYDGADIPGHPKMGTWMAEDVPDFVKANFRTYRSRDGWAFMGSSSGGFVGLKTVVQHPERFKAVIASGPDTAPDSPLWKGHRAAMDANNPEKLAQKLIDRKGPDIYVNFQIGTMESGKAKVDRFVRNWGRGPVHTTVRVIQGGGHNGKDYVRGMKEGSLEWISKVLKGPVAGPPVTSAG
ncbi:alpha/beta hydrolase-fold protein [Streptomyces sp. NPDC089919]|uniref:alpha/beta hydrolase n=1 Tax=Streptomyces sp. NPDC089919 TaxID=3155188 RepID=UPI003436022D